MYSAIKCMSPLSLCFYLLFSLNSNAREQQPNLIKYTFAIDHKSINQKISIEQPLIIPQYEISLRSTITSKTCTKIVCTDDNKNKKLYPKQTWNGVFDWKQKINLDISEEEFSFRLSNIITGLDPILSSKIVSMGIAKKVFKKRPENWEQFTKMMAKLNKLINHAGIIYDLYTDIVLVHGYENARDLGYYDEKLCVKNSYSCNADQLEVRKKLITETSKNIIINYTPSKNSGKVKLYPNEVDYFDFYIGQNDKDFFIDPRDKHNSYLVNYEKNTSNGDVTINITPIARRKVPLPDNFLYTFSDSYISCIFFEWRFSKGNFNELVLSELKNIYLNYSVCEKRFLSCKKLFTKELRLDQITNLPTKASDDEILLERITLGTDIIRENKKYRVDYEIVVKNSMLISAPSSNKNSITTQFIPY